MKPLFLFRHPVSRPLVHTASFFTQPATVQIDNLFMTVQTMRTYLIPGIIILDIIIVEKSGLIKQKSARFKGKPSAKEFDKSYQKCLNNLFCIRIMTLKKARRKKDVTVGFHIEITRNRKIVYEHISEACELFETEDDINHISTNGCYSLDDRAYLIRILTEWMNAITIPVNSSEYRVVRVRVNEGVLSESPYQDDMYMDFSGFTGYVSFKTWDSDSTVAPVYWDDETLRKLPKAYIRNSDRTGSDETGYAFYKHELYAISDPESLLWQNEAK